MKRLFVSLLVAACSSSEPAPSPPALTGFVPDGEVDGPTVFLRGHRDGDKLTVEVVARGMDDVHGAALRLHWDPAKLGYIEARGSDAWSQRAVRLAKEGAPGELAIAWTERGSAGALSFVEETILGTIDFRVSAGGTSPLEFRTERSKLIDSKGAPISVAWRGGKLHAFIP